MNDISIDSVILTNRDSAYSIETASTIPQIEQGGVILRPYASRVEVSGRMLGQMLEACGGYLEQVRSILQRNGIVEIAPEGWYLIRDLIVSLNQAIRETSPVLLNRMGAALAERIVCFPGMAIEESIALLNQYFHRWHRRGEAGGYLLLETIPAASSMLVQCRHPYPCAMDMGLLKRLIQKVSGEKDVMVFHDHRQSQNCRKTGAEACKLMVCW